MPAIENLLSRTRAGRRLTRAKIARWTIALLVAVTPKRMRAAGATYNYWEYDVRQFEKQDRQTPPPARPILFCGDSNIRLWDLGTTMPDLPALNRGFGGSTTADIVHFFDRLVLRYDPRVIVFCSGDNDIIGGKTPEAAAADFATLLRQIRGRLPDTPVICLPAKPSVAAWNLYPRLKRFNDLVRGMAEQDPLLIVAATDQTLLGPTGQPRAELFQCDGLHLNADGYRLWSAIVRPLIEANEGLRK